MIISKIDKLKAIKDIWRIVLNLDIDSRKKKKLDLYSDRYNPIQ